MTNVFNIPSDEDIIKILTGKYNSSKISAFGITHYSYKDCEENNLVNIDNEIKIHKKCKAAFEKMQQDAKKEGLNINIVSGYRSSKYQITIFKRKFHDKNNPTHKELEERLKYSAPSGFSEHHTGLAIDINDTEEDFAKTPEFAWLIGNALKYGFEMSFPKNNSQNLGYEPWHWRFIGDDESKKIFYSARNN